MNNYFTPAIQKETQRGFDRIEIRDEMYLNRDIFIDMGISTALVSDVLLQLMYLERQDKNTPVNIYINSPGGSVTDGMVLYDFIRMMKAPVNTICTGMAASMGAIIYLAGDNRYIFPHSKIMIHDASFSNAEFSGLKPDEIQEKTNSLLETTKMLRKIVSERTGQSLKSVTAKMKQDSFFKADEALKYGLVTAVVDDLESCGITTKKGVT